VSRSVDLEDRDRNMERFENGVDQAPLLPGRMVGAAQRDQDVIGPERANRVFKRGRRRFVPDLRPRLCPRRELADVTENDPEPLVGLVPGAVRVGSEPSKAPDEHRRDNENLRRRLDEPPNQGRKVLKIGDSLAGRDQEACPAGRHPGIMHDSAGRSARSGFELPLGGVAGGDHCAVGLQARRAQLTCARGAQPIPEEEVVLVPPHRKRPQGNLCAGK
jgi:hypothetical protein